MLTKKIYEQVRELIEDEVRDKKPGELIDTEVSYARRFGVSRPTVRKAVEDLIKIGLIRRIPGKGLVMAAEGEIPYRGRLLIALPHWPEDGFMFRVILGCVDQANALGFSYKIINHIERDERLEAVRKERLDDYVAAITCCYDDNEHEYQIVDLFNQADLPVMLIDNPPEKRIAPCVTCDDFSGGYQMGAYLAGKGHRNVINLSLNRRAQTIKRRDQGFLKAMDDAGIGYDHSLLLYSDDYTHEFYKRFSPQDFKSGRYTAICSHSTLAINAITGWMTSSFLRVYDDISLIGYGDHSYLPAMAMPITCIEIPSQQMGKSAVDEISAALLENRVLQDIEHEVRLVKRNTVKTISQT